VLRHNHVEVVLPEQRPAPLPAIVYGDVRTAREDLTYSVKYLVEAVRAGYKIVCSEPSAALCLRQELRHYVSSEAAALVSQNTVELTNYLLDLQGQGKLQTPVQSVGSSFVYHLPCHLNAVGQAGATLKLLRDTFQVDITDLAAGCCGLSGTFGMQKKNYELSDAISDSVKQALQAASTQDVLTECAACKMQIEHIASTTVTHPIKIIARAYGL
jgi:Fe-S oxidoreductase